MSENDTAEQGRPVIEVRTLAEDEWATYREVRLRALKESPEAFAADLEDEAEYDEEFWRSRMNRSRRLLAEVDGQVVGVVSVGDDSTDDELATGELFGLWVTPEWRGRSVAAALVREGAQRALADGMRQLSYWVGTDNGRAVAFASSFGFRPTDDRRAMGGDAPVPGDEQIEGEEESRFVLALG